MTLLCEMLGLGRVSALYSVNHWEREGVVKSERIGQHRIVRLDPDFVLAKEFKALLREIIIHSDEYHTLRSVVKAKMKAINRHRERNPV